VGSFNSSNNTALACLLHPLYENVNRHDGIFSSMGRYGKAYDSDTEPNWPVMRVYFIGKLQMRPIRDDYFFNNCGQFWSAFLI
jgi:hypothetical protein